MLIELEGQEGGSGAREDKLRSYKSVLWQTLN
jgi:hypothetical protein